MKLKYISKNKTHYTGWEPDSFRKVKVFNGFDVVVTGTMGDRLLKDYPNDWKVVEEIVSSEVDKSEQEMLEGLAEKKSKRKGR